MLSLMDGGRCEKTGRGGEEEVGRRMEEEEIHESLGGTARPLTSAARAASGSSFWFVLTVSAAESQTISAH